MIIWYYLISYFIGNILFGYIVGKIMSGKDIRLVGSKNVGARNAGRLFGKKAFLFTFLGDAAKGVIVVVVGKYAGFSSEILLAGLFFACFGHIKPVLFCFKGGKGISTFIGGLIAIQPIFIIFIISGFLLFYPLYKGFTIPGFIALFIVCTALSFTEENWLCSVIGIVTWLMIYFSHRISWRKFLFEQKPL
ncbi:MAG: glycerol-3-phosphate acyltransferase [Bacillus sp. (in: firmicutes)]